MTAHYHVKTLGVQNLVMSMFSVPGWRRSPHCGADGGGGDWGSDISATVFGRGGWGCCECGLFTGSAARRSQCRIWARCQTSLSTVHVPLQLKLQWSSLFVSACASGLKRNSRHGIVHRSANLCDSKTDWGWGWEGQLSARRRKNQGYKKKGRKDWF